MRHTILIPAVLLVLAGGCLSMPREGGAVACDRAEYTCNVHREVVSNCAGFCPKCGGRLAKVDTGSRVVFAQKIPELYACPLHTNVIAYEPSVCPICGLNMEKPSPPPGKVDRVYACLVHPEVSSDRPGVCPKCGLKLELMGVVPDRYRR